MADFRDIVEAHGGLIQRIASSYERRPALVDELVQDTLLAVWRALDRFEGHASLRTYVARIAHNVCVSHVRKASRTSGVELEDEMASDTPLPDEATDKTLARERLLAAVQVLPLSLRQVTTLYLEDFSHAEIAEALGISENNAAVRLNRAKAALKQALQAKGGEK